MRLSIVIALAAAAVACNDAPTGEGPSGPVGTPADQNAADVSVPVVPEEAGDLPEPGPGLRFVGNWAADQESCESTAWQFTQTTLTTPAGSVCSFNRVTEVPGGYDIQATCTAEAPPTSDTLKIRFAESADGMLFESETIADAGLVFCGRDV